MATGVPFIIKQLKETLPTVRFFPYPIMKEQKENHLNSGSSIDV
jgi:hypothetical protein